ncbi:hypothetical protein RJ640_027618 [Escallonia rubra]|uniref:Uncharacterized protein n=1 Tax=Escallonia rubra TaxID=112253 RepID=A0AA88QXA9_9ASTE|nr:hypothetical protein RJ640_027618 [Escallonia rubra]
MQVPSQHPERLLSLGSKRVVGSQNPLHQELGSRISFNRSYLKNRYAQLTNEQRALHIKQVSQNRKRRSINVKSLAIARRQTEDIPEMRPEAAAKRGLLQSHDSISECLHEAAHFQMPKALRRLFAIILVYWEPNDVRNLCDIHFSSLSEDFLKMSPMIDKMRECKTLQGVDFFLESMGRSITEYDLPTMESTFSDAINVEKRELGSRLIVRSTDSGLEWEWSLGWEDDDQ